MLPMAMSMMIKPIFIVIVLLFDAVLWGIWFGGLWNYRSAFATRLTDSYIHISMSFAMPLIISSIIFIFTVIKSELIRLHRVKLFKISIAISRFLYLLTSMLIYLRVFDNIGLLYISSAIVAIAYALGSLAGIAWTDYVADNIPDKWKSRYIALDNMLSTIGALIGVAIAGVILISDIGIHGYGKLFLVVSTLFLIDIPLIMLVKEFSESYTKVSWTNSLLYEKSSLVFYIAIVLLYISLNLSASLIAPYIMYKLNGDEVWITMINGASFIASLVSPLIWGEILRKTSSLTLARIAISLTIVSNSIFPYLKSLDLQIVRSFIAGAGAIGIWISLFSHIIRDVDAEHRIQHSSKIYLIQNIVPAIAVNIGGFLAEIIENLEIIFLLSLIGLITIPMIKMYQKQR